MKKEDFYGTFWDVSEWSEEQKIKWQQKCFELGFTWSGSSVDINHLYADTYFLEKTDKLTYSEHHFRTGDCPTEKHYEDMFPEQSEEKLDIIAEIVKLVQEAQGVEEEEDSFDGLVYVAPEDGQDWLKYFSLSRKSCSEAQWNYVLENCPICKGTDGSNDYLQICNDGEGWFDNDDLTSKDIVVSFNNIFQYPEED